MKTLTTLALTALFVGIGLGAMAQVSPLSRLQAALTAASGTAAIRPLNGGAQARNFKALATELKALGLAARIPEGSIEALVADVRLAWTAAVTTLKPLAGDQAQLEALFEEVDTALTALVFRLTLANEDGEISADERAGISRQVGVLLDTLGIPPSYADAIANDITTIIQGLDLSDEEKALIKTDLDAIKAEYRKNHPES